MHKLYLISAGLGVGLTLLSIIYLMNFGSHPQTSVLTSEITRSQSNSLVAFDTYENNVHGIKIQYPSSWKEVDLNEGNLVLGFVSNNQNEKGLSENFLLQTIESESYNNISPKDLATRATLIYKSNIPGFHLYSSGPHLTPTGLSVYKIEYGHTSRDLQMTTLEIWTINGDGDDLYRVIFTADTSEYSILLPTVKKMVDSLTINPGQVSKLDHVA